MANPMPDQFTATALSDLTRKSDRGSHDKSDVYAILDAALVCHIAYTVDGQPFATPTLFWRNGDTLYWHGSSHGRMISCHAQGQRVCLTVTHLDALNLGRSGIASSVQYRSAMVFGTTRAITEPDQKRIHMAQLIDRKFPGRSADQRAIHDHEINGITVIEMPIEEAAAKVKSGGVVERTEADYDIPVWAGVIPIAQTVGVAEPDPRLSSDIEMPSNVAAYGTNRRLDEVLSHCADQRRAVPPAR